MINMEKTRRTLCVVLMTVFCLAPLMPVKAAKGEMKYSMEYIIQQRLFVKGQQVTLLNTNLEWPVCVAGTDVFALRNYLSQLFFDVCFCENNLFFYFCLDRSISISEFQANLCIFTIAVILQFDYACVNMSIYSLNILCFLLIDFSDTCINVSIDF